jgi:hypothetical protein
MCTVHYQRVLRLGTPYLAEMPSADDLPGERWLPVEDFEGYEVSDLGRVRSWNPDHPWRPVPRLLTLSPNKKEYLRVGLLDGEGRVRTRTVHRLVMCAFVGPRPRGKQVRHLDGDKSNNALTNLRYGTASQNTFDTVRHGTHPWAGRDGCVNNHEFTPENTYIRPNGSRGCKQCRRDISRRQRLRRQEIVRAFIDATGTTSERAAKVAAEFGVKPATVFTYVSPAKPKLSERREAIAKAYLDATGTSSQRAAKVGTEFGVKPGTVLTYVGQAGIRELQLAD